VVQVLFESRNTEGAQLRELAVRRVRFVLRRLTWFIRRARVKLFDGGAPPGGDDKLCQLELKTGGGGIVIIQSRAKSWRLAMEAALRRAARAVLRTWKHGLTYSRPRRRAIGFNS
jgi:hypothetical protein